MSSLDGTELASSNVVSKGFRAGMERSVAPAVTLERVRPSMRRFGVTRIANLTGLDRLGVPVVAVHRPNSRSVSVSQGKGCTLVAAQVSGLMESIEGYHAEHVRAPLLLCSHRELRAPHRVADVAGLPRLSTSSFHEDTPLLWIRGTDLVSGASSYVPYEMVHLDFRLPLPAGSGAFVMSSNGLASGNHLLEALSHAICELVERDANTLFQLSGTARQAARRVDLSSVDDGACCEVLQRFESAELDVVVWETTTDVGLCSFICEIADRDRRAGWASPTVPGSGCHPRRAIALLRALTEAAQGRLTLLSGARDDLSNERYDAERARDDGARIDAALKTKARVAFAETPDRENDCFDADLTWELERLKQAGFEQVIAVNLTHPEIGIPVVRVIVPYLETMSELPGFVPGRRAQNAIAAVDR